MRPTNCHERENTVRDSSAAIRVSVYHAAGIVCARAVQPPIKSDTATHAQRAMRQLWVVMAMFILWAV